MHWAALRSHGIAPRQLVPFWSLSGIRSFIRRPPNDRPNNRGIRSLAYEKLGSALALAKSVDGQQALSFFSKVNRRSAATPQHVTRCSLSMDTVVP